MDPLHHSQNLQKSKIYIIISLETKGQCLKEVKKQNDLYKARLCEPDDSARSQQSVSQSSYQGIYLGYQRCGDPDLAPLVMCMYFASAIRSID